MKNKSRKSKKLLVVVAVVLMLGLVVGMGAMTYSKYVTSGTTGSQSATAAKWGFVVTVNADNLFATDYTKLSDATLATKATGTGVAVHASGTTNVVAPGTTGSMTISISGKAEVRAKLTISAGTAGAKEIHLDDYLPVKWTLSDGASDVKTGKLSDIISYLEGTSQIFEVNTTADYNKTYTLTWKWDLDGDEATNAKDTLIGYKAATKNYDEIKDTYVGNTKLGDVVKSSTDYDNIGTEMSFNLTISVEQIQ